MKSLTNRTFDIYSTVLTYPSVEPAVEQLGDQHQPPLLQLQPALRGRGRARLHFRAVLPM